MPYVIVVYIFSLYIKPLLGNFPNDLLHSNAFRMSSVTASDTRKNSAATWSCNTDVNKTTFGVKEISMMRNVRQYITTRK